jgi:hypothetical protein
LNGDEASAKLPAMPRGGRGSGVVICLVGVLSPATASAATYAVGPGRPYPDLQAVARLLRPGDRVEVDGGATYPGGVVLRESGTARAKITLVGIRVGGRRPVIAGGATTLELRGDHYVLEGFDVTGGTSRCLFHHADDITVRDTAVHDCPGHGILGADDGTGSLTLAYVEVYRSGNGDSKHPIYVATDEEDHPGSVFRMEHCYVHDGNGGNDVKSRAERNEIYANWIEGARYHELELVGPDGEDRKHRREDSDVVGNVIYKTRSGYAIRVGGDGSGDSNGRYRFVNNTILLGPGPGGAAFRIFSGLESIEMHNNAIAREGEGGPVRVMVEQEVRWAAGRPVVTGTNNWIPTGSSGVPSAWIHTLAGADPRFVSERDLHPAAGSPLIGAGAVAPASPPHFEFPAPLAAPRELPPQGVLERVGTATSRLRGTADIGAFAYDGPPLPAVKARGGCGCGSHSVGGATPPGLAAFAAALLAMLRSRRLRPPPR